jgi:hypothetical protein
MRLRLFGMSYGDYESKSDIISALLVSEGEEGTSIMLVSEGRCRPTGRSCSANVKKGLARVFCTLSLFLLRVAAP